jgi:hypothetical protein
MIKPFKFFRTPFNPRQHDTEGFTFIGVSPFIVGLDGRRYRRMIFMDNTNNTALSANIIYEHEEPYHMADVIQLIGDRMFQIPRETDELIPVNETVNTPTEDEIAHALSVGREAYLNGNDSADNPFIRRELYEAFEQGWELEQDYEILRQAQQRANEGF